MLSIVGYNAWNDGDLVNGVSFPQKYDTVEIMNKNTNSAFKFSGIDIVKDVDGYTSKELKIGDGGYSVIHSEFNNTLFAGILPDNYENLGKVVISRYVEYSDDWSVTATYDIKTSQDGNPNYSLLKQIYSDSTISSGSQIYKTEYYYWKNSSLVVDDTKTSVKTIDVYLNTNFLSDEDECYPLFMDVGITSNRNQQTGIMTPLASRYPIYVKNAMTNYHSGTISASIMSEQVIEELRKSNGFTGDVNLHLKTLRNDLTSFLSNGKPKCFRSTGGDVWIIQVTGNIACNFKNIGGYYICNFSFDYVEIADGKTSAGIQKVMKG